MLEVVRQATFELATLERVLQARIEEQFSIYNSLLGEEGLEDLRRAIQLFADAVNEQIRDEDLCLIEPPLELYDSDIEEDSEPEEEEIPTITTREHRLYLERRDIYKEIG